MKNPEYIYKYQALNINNLSALNSSQLWFSDFSSLNDPFEATYSLSPELIFSKACNSQHIDQTIAKIIADSAVCSFSQISPDDKDHFETNALMWSHYAGQFSGICIEFDKKSLLSSMDNSESLKMSFDRVIYSDDLHSYRYSKQSRETEVLFKKHSAWKYEDEFRVVFSKDFNDSRITLKAIGLHSYNPVSISRIFIGGRMSSNQINLLKVIRDNINNEIELVKLSIGNRGYGFDMQYFDVDDKAQE